MRKLLGKIIISAILLLIIFLGSFFGSYAVFSEKSTQLDSAYLTRYHDNENEYYLQKADPFIEFFIDYPNASSTDNFFELTDESNQVLIPKTQKTSSSQLKILPPEQGYEGGRYYTLRLYGDAYFSGDYLRNARTLVFCIEKEAVEKYEFTQNVKQNVSVNEIDNTLIRLQDSDIKTGDIIFGQNQNDEYVVYKVNRIMENGIAQIEIPSLDEVYSQLEVYGEYTWSPQEIAANPQITTEIIENVRQSSFFDELIRTAYADDTPRDAQLQVDIKYDNKKSTLEIEIKISLEPGKTGLFGIKQLKNQQVTITLNASVGFSARCNINGISNWDVSFSLNTNLSWAIDIGWFTDEFKADKDLETVFDNSKVLSKLDYNNNVKKLTNALNKFAADLTAGEIKLFNWRIPIPSVPGLYFSAEVKLFVKLEIAAEITIGQSNITNYIVGISFRNRKFERYSNVYKSDSDINLSLKGKAKCKAGIKLVLKATLVNEKLANISIDPQIGLYADLYVTWPILVPDDIKPDNFKYGYFEPGIYISADINATLNLLIKKFEFSSELYEKKFPIKAFTLGNDKIALGLKTEIQTVRAVNNLVAAPEIIFEYYDVKKGITDAEILPIDKLKFVSGDSTVLETTGNKLVVPQTDRSGSIYITAVYRHADGNNYSAIFRVLVSGSLIEGKVSAYSANNTASALRGALVKLYSASNDTTPIDTAVTGDDGKFSFSVSKDTYRIVISAEGYKTLTTTQSVGDDEIKYTEHILLIDSGQTGAGSASGRITNALDGRGLSNVRIRLRPNWNTTSGEYTADFVAYTNSSGEYTISGVPSGYYTVEAYLDGFVTGYGNIIVMRDNPITDFDFSITPVLSDDEIRIVLTWGSTPSDLDSHLIGRTPSGQAFNVYYSNKVYRFEGVEMANLDVDDTTSYGPETITILRDIYGKYIYAVHNYSNRGSSSSEVLSYSGATVKVYKGSIQIAEYNVPTGQTGTYWTVFEISGNGRIVPINTVSNTKPKAEDN